MSDPNVAVSPDEINNLCRLAKSFVQATDSRADILAEPTYAHGVFDALRWVLGYPRLNEGLGVRPVTAADIEALMDVDVPVRRQAGQLREAGCIVLLPEQAAMLRERVANLGDLQPWEVRALLEGLAGDG